MKTMTSIRWKILFVFGISIVASVFTVLFLILFAANFLTAIPFLRLILTFAERNYGVMPIAIPTGGVFFMIYFFIFSQRSISYIEEISANLEKISSGDLDIRIPIKSKDELGELAGNINSMTSRLKDSLEEERNAEKTKSDLVTSVSHDLRTPLTSILGYLELVVKDNYRDEITLRYYADIAYTKSLRLKKLVDELFEYTRVSYGGIKLIKSKINVVELIEQLVEDFVPLLEEAGMECRLAPMKKEIFIEADGYMLVRVFENLLTNAIRYGSEGKFIDIELEENEKVIISFINYGEPIPVKDIPYLFERFYRVEKSRSEEMGGTGLGLAIAKNIIELHKGEISAYSNREKTVFEVKLIRQKETLI